MLTHYLKIAFRNLFKYKMQSLINIVGLAIGITFFSFGFHWLKYETSFDNFYPDSKNIYKVYIIEKLSGKKESLTPYILHKALKKDFPEVKEAVFNDPWRQGGYICNDKFYADPYFLSVEKDFLKIFPQQVLYGKTDDLLATSGEIVVTESFARKCWGTPDKAVGQIIQNFPNKSFTVTSVIKDMPSNTTLQADGCKTEDTTIRFYKNMPENKQWEIFHFDTYILLHNNIDKKAFEKKLRTYAIDNKLNPSIYIGIVPITAVKHTLGLFTKENTFNLSYIKTFAVASALLLICAFFNFLNLLFNRFLQRTREIKLRDSLGAGQQTLLLQFSLEIGIQIIIALLLSLALLEIIAPSFEQQFETYIIRDNLIKEFIILSLFSLFTLLLISWGPLHKLIHFASDLKGNNRTRQISQARFRQISISIQLIISVFFIFSAFALFRQVYYMNNTDWGFNKDNLIQLTMNVSKREEITREVASLPTVKAFIPTGLFTLSNENTRGESDVEWEGKSEISRPVFQVIDVGSNFPKDMEIPLLKGRYFEDADIIQPTNDGMPVGSKILINEEAAKIIGGDVIGKKISMKSNWFSSATGYGREEFEIIGVVRDFHGLSLRNPIVPMIIKQSWEKWTGYYNYVRVYPGTEKQSIETIRNVFQKHASPRDGVSKIITVKQLIQDLNKSETATLQLFSLLAFLCILISIFGIYSISLSNMERRKKEIAVRKVLGASTKSILLMFFKEYIWLVLVANLISLPIAYLFINRWLEQYPYRIHLSVGMYLIVIMVNCLLVIVTVLQQVIKAAGENPAEVIKSE